MLIFLLQVVAHKAECLEKDLNLRGAKNDFEKNINQLHEKVQMTIEKKEKVKCFLNLFFIFIFNYLITF